MLNSNLWFRYAISLGKQEMIKIKLSELMGREKFKISDVARLTKLNRSTITALYRETATRVDLDTIERLCQLFRCEVGDLFKVVDNDTKK